MRSACARLLALALLALPAAGADDRPAPLPAPAQGGLPGLDPGYKMTTHRVVLLTEGGINPRLVTLDEGQLVAWISYSPTPSTVVFEREVARHMICHSLVNFSIQDDELRSTPIEAGEFASFCQLRPGRYRYKVVRESPPGQEAPLPDLEGEIVVGNVPQ